MTGLLASVRNLEEARLVMECQVDILDLKDPECGALGALPVDLVRQIIYQVDGRIPVSATIGDVQFKTEVLSPKIHAMSETGVDIIKVGVFGNFMDSSVLKMLHDFAEHDIRIVLVIFAEDMQILPDLAVMTEMGIAGVMVDTRDKVSGPLRQKISDKKLSGIVQELKNANLLCGLAGALGINDILPLLALKPDYLGFRSALCRDGRRQNEIDKHSVLQIRNIISEENRIISNNNALTA